MAGEGVSSKLAFINSTMHRWVDGLCTRVRQNETLDGRKSPCSDITGAKFLQEKLMSFGDVRWQLGRLRSQPNFGRFLREFIKHLIRLVGSGWPLLWRSNEISAIDIL